MAETTTTLSSATRDPAQAPYLVFLLQVSRPGLWTTTALFYLMPLGHGVIFHSARFWLGLFFVLFPLGLLLYGVNDIVDAEADRYNPRKGTFLFGSRGATKQLAALRWQIAIAEIPFLTVFFFLMGPRIVGWFAALLIAVGLYNAPRFGWKSHPPLDVLIQASYLLVFVLSSWLNHVNQLPWPTFLFGALFAMHSHVFGEVMDIGPDRFSGRRTTATLGSKFSKFRKARRTQAWSSSLACLNQARTSTRQENRGTRSCECPDRKTKTEKLSRLSAPAGGGTSAHRGHPQELRG